MGRHASYSVVEDGPEVVCLSDNGPWTDHLSITNDAEWVVAQVAPHLRGRRLEYYDSDGSRDQLLVKDGKFAGFAPGVKQESEHVGGSVC